MQDYKLSNLLIEEYQQFVSHWQNTYTNGTLANTLIISISDGVKRAKVITYKFDEQQIIKDEGRFFLETLMNKIQWAKKKFDNPLKWLRIEWPTQENEMTWKTFSDELNKYKRNYFRSGIAYKGNTKPWCLLTEMELNANACLYPGADTPVAKVNHKNLEVYIKSRHSSKNLPNYEDKMTLLVFQTSGMFFDASTGDVEQLCSLPRQHGHRQIDQLNSDITADLIGKTTTYLSNQVLEGGRFEYGRFPCFGRTINFYNTLRHASSIYAMIEGYEFCRNNNNSGRSDNQLKDIANNIDSALDYMFDKVIRFYSDDKAYVLEENGEIKLGANAVAILALTKYYQVFNKSTKRDQYLATAEKLANGILAMQKDNGQFVHILDSKTLNVIAESRVIYYDGEAAFGLMRLYGITKDDKWIDCASKAFDYFISAGHNGAHDHWLSYCSNELVIYKPEKKYFQFAVNNVKGYTNFIKNRITTFPTLLELSMAFHKILLKLDEHPEHLDVLKGFDVNDFYEALHTRANYLINGFFFPEVAMFYKKPNTILHGCFIRHHAFRVRIDDVEHYLSGWVAYHDLISKGVYPKTAKQVNRSLVDEYKVLTPSGLTTATGGRWLVKPSKQWSATGLCIHPAGFKEGCLLVARGESMQRGYLPKVAVKSFTLKGAGAIITDSEEDYLDFGIPVLHVNNVRQATLDIGRWARKYYQGDVIGITGSAGKTTTVAMLAHALKIEGEVGQTKGSANLPIGIAWNMASLSQSAKSWVLEMAIGNMALNSQLVQPDVAIITNIAAAHLEYHNTLDMVAIKKSRIFEGMKPGSLAVICRDIAQYDLIVKKAKTHDLNIIDYGEHEDSDIRLVSYQYGSTVVNIKGKNYTIDLFSIGKHMVLNAMAVLAVADYKCLDINKIIDQMKTFKAVEGRGEVFKTQFELKQVTIYDEAYNANPLSMRAAINAFVEVDIPSERKLLILGDMLELGANSKQYHLDLADEIDTSNFREVILVGELSSFMKEKLNKITSVHHYLDTDYLKTELNKFVKDDDFILIKASNSIGLRKLFINK